MLLDIQTKAKISFEHRTIVIEEQIITLGDVILFKIPYREFSINQIFEPDHYRFINNETLEPLLSQYLLGELYRDKSVRGFFHQNNIKIKKWQGIHQ